MLNSKAKANLCLVLCLSYFYLGLASVSTRQYKARMVNPNQWVPTNNRKINSLSAFSCGTLCRKDPNCGAFFVDDVNKRCQFGLKPDEELQEGSVRLYTLETVLPTTTTTTTTTTTSTTSTTTTITTTTITETTFPAIAWAPGYTSLENYHVYVVRHAPTSYHQGDDACADGYPADYKAALAAMVYRNEYDNFHKVIENYPEEEEYWVGLRGKNDSGTCNTSDGSPCDLLWWSSWTDDLYWSGQSWAPDIIKTISADSCFYYKGGQLIDDDCSVPRKRVCEYLDFSSNRRLKGLNSVTWDEAQATCEADGANLVSPRLVDDWYNLLEYIAGIPPNNSVWIGLRDPVGGAVCAGQTACDGVLEWVGGQALGWTANTDWAPMIDKDSGTERCVHVRIGPGDIWLEDADCSSKMYAVCQK